MSKISIKHLLLLAGIILQFGLQAQVFNQMIAHGDGLFEKEDYYGSIYFYERALKMDSLNVEILYKYGKNLSLINNHKSASRYLYKAYLIDRGKTYQDHIYELASAYHYSGNYRKARTYYNKALILSLIHISEPTRPY